MTLEKVQNLAPSAFTDHAHERTSDRYLFTNTIDLAKVLLDKGWQIDSAEEQRTRKATKTGYQLHRIVFSNPDFQIDDHNDVKPQILLSNEHYGSRSLQVHFGLFRFICANGIIAAIDENSIEDTRLRHHYSNIENVDKMLDYATKQANRIGESLNRFKSVDLDYDAQNDFADKAIKIRFGKEEDKTSLVAAQVLLSQRQEDRASDLWTVFNRVQENLIRGGMTGQRIYEDPKTGQVKFKTRKIRAVRNLTQNYKINTSLWELAESFANN
jgi:hypothetical protein